MRAVIGVLLAAIPRAIAIGIDPLAHTAIQRIVFVGDLLGRGMRGVLERQQCQAIAIVPGVLDVIAGGLVSALRSNIAQIDASFWVALSWPPRTKSIRPRALWFPLPFICSC